MYEKNLLLGIVECFKAYEKANRDCEDAVDKMHDLLNGKRRKWGISLKELEEEYEKSREKHAHK